MGQLDRLRTELPESAEPIVPKRWGELNTVTIAFGHGLSVAPLQASMAIGALMNGGMLIPPTFLKRTRGRGAEARQAGDQARDQREDALPDAAQRREGHRPARPRCRATTSAARPAPPRRWSTAAIPRPSCSPPSWRCCRPTSRAISSLIMLDEPQGLPETHGFATSGWNAAPTAGKIIARDRADARASSRASTCRRPTS